MSLIDREKTMEEIPIDVCDGFEVTDIIEKMPPVQAIPIPEGATNGDMIKAIFPDIKIHEHEKTDICDAYIQIDIWDFSIYVSKDFWDAPYKRGNEDGRN